MNRLDRQRQVLAIAIAALAGCVDALGFFAAGGYFVSFMSGNTTRLAVDLATESARAETPALLIAGFVAGAALGRVVAGACGSWRKIALLCTVAALLASAAFSFQVGAHAASLASMVLAMGAVNNVFHREGEDAVGLTYMTGALMRLGQGIGAAILGQRPDGWRSYLFLWCGLFAGAVSGALIHGQLGGGAGWLAALFAAILAMVAWRLGP